MARILIVDDSAMMRQLLVDILAAQGHDIVGQAKTAQEAVEQYKALRPDLVTLDVVMPERSDVSTLDAVGQIMKENPRAKILMVSSIGQPYVITAMLDAGARDFIIKPFQPHMVVQTVERILGGK